MSKSKRLLDFYKNIYVYYIKIEFTIRNNRLAYYFLEWKQNKNQDKQNSGAMTLLALEKLWKIPKHRKGISRNIHRLFYLYVYKSSLVYIKFIKNTFLPSRMRLCAITGRSRRPYFKLSICSLSIHRNFSLMFQSSLVYRMPTHCGARKWAIVEVYERHETIYRSDN